MKIQMNATAAMTYRRESLRGFQRVRTPSMNSKKYSNVFGKMKSSNRSCIASKSATPTNR